jgi:hypothetical protein
MVLHLKHYLDLDISPGLPDASFFNRAWQGNTRLDRITQELTLDTKAARKAGHSHRRSKQTPVYVEMHEFIDR